MLEKLDIIITTRNRISELIFTLNIIFEQGFHQAQVYIIDDASIDGTFDIIKRTYPEIIIQHNENSLGLIHNRNILMGISNGSYILSLDDDSHIRSRKDIEDAIILLEKSPAYGIFSFRAFEQLEDPPKRELLESRVELKKTYIGCGHIIKRSTFELVGNYREEFVFYCEELDFSIRAFKNKLLVVSQADLVVHHRIDWNTRLKNKRSEQTKGIYGAGWRSKMGFSNNLIVVGLYYPLLTDIFFLFYFSLKRFYHFALKKGDFYGFFLGLARFITFIPYIFKESDKLSYKQFYNWYRLPS
jgi:GT2 family glycosyltransferase